MPLRAAMPERRLTMVESKVRKAAFLRDAVRQLGFADAEVYNGRLEQLLIDPTRHESAAFASIRAVKADRRLLKTLAVLMRPGGLLLWFRTGPFPLDRESVLPLTVAGTASLIPANRSGLVVLRR